MVLSYAVARRCDRRNGEERRAGDHFEMEASLSYFFLCFQVFGGLLDYCVAWSARSRYFIKKWGTHLVMNCNR